MAEESNNSTPYYEVDSFEGFEELAQDATLSKYMKIGFPDDYRIDFEESICNDISQKLNLIEISNQRILDVGCGCSDLPVQIFELSEKYNHELTLLDSQKMLLNLPQKVKEKAKLVFGKFPDCKDFISDNTASFDSIICYSVIQYPFYAIQEEVFLRELIKLLKPQGRLLIGDIPNMSKRERFFESEIGKKFLDNWAFKSEGPVMKPNKSDRKLDDKTVIGWVSMIREWGYHAYIMPQSRTLPMSNRREDLLIVRP